MSDILQEQNVDAAFSRQSIIFDEIDEQNGLLAWMRERVRKEVMSHIAPDAHMLELNCGTGLDTLYFAKKGIHVTATDNATGMIQQLNEKIRDHDLQTLISVEKCSFNNLDQLDRSGLFDYVFSNFGGLNCTKDLAKVLSDMDALLKPGGMFTLVIMPRVCPWEMAMFLKGYFKTAIRRFSKNGSRARVEGVYFNCYYYNPDYIVRHAGPSYRLIGLKSLALAVPPPYIERFREKHPKLFAILEKWENKLCDRAPFNHWGDHFMITMQKN